MLIGLGGLAFAGHRRVLEPRAAVILVSRGVAALAGFAKSIRERIKLE
jgi:hypothetical protein